MSSIQLNNRLNKNDIERQEERRRSVEKFKKLWDECVGKRYKEEELMLFLFKYFRLLGYSVLVSDDTYAWFVERGYYPDGVTSYKEDMIAKSEDEFFVIEFKGDWSDSPGGSKVRGNYEVIGQIVKSASRYNEAYLAICVSEDRASLFYDWSSSFPKMLSLHLFTIDGYGRVRHQTPEEFVEYIKSTKLPLKNKINIELTDRYIQERLNSGGE
jgi:hypothetical protein